MTTGTMMTARARPRHTLLVALGLGLLLCAAALPADASGNDPGPRSLDALMAAFAQVPSAQSRYVEHKQVSLLEMPLTYEGRLTYRAPDYLKKEVITPRFESYEIADGRLVIAHDGQRRELGLDELPPLQAFIESLRATLAGDLPALRRHYEVAFEAKPRGWTLHLKPRASEVRRYLKDITVRGEDAVIRAVEIRETSGDLSRMTLKPAP